MAVRPTPDQVLALAPDRAAAIAALPLATPNAWSAAGCDDAAVWGRYVATTAEPYDVAVDLSDDADGPAYRCNCPSRKIPCKHALSLLLLYANDGVAPARPLPFAAEWLRGRAARSDDGENASATDIESTVNVAPSHDGGQEAVAGDERLGGGARAPRPERNPEDPARTKRRLERAEKMRAGLNELDRWLADRVRVGLAAPELADIATWDRLAARLVDAQCGGLANRVRRVATKIGQHPRWHEDILEEMAVLHALALGAKRSSTLPSNLADGVHAAAGLNVGKDDVLAGVPSTARWIVAGESRTREDRITVQRTWLASDSGAGPSTWAMVLSFGTFGNELVSDLTPGTVFEADVHWYPGGVTLRALVGRTHTTPVPHARGPRADTIDAALAVCGWALAAEPWIERYPVCIEATPARLGSHRWALADETGAVAVAPGFGRMAELVAVSGGRPVPLMGEWSADGLLPLTLFAGTEAIVL